MNPGTGPAIRMDCPATTFPRDAQIVAVADAFDAMTSNRPYRPGMPIERVTEIFRGGRGKQWAADVVDTLLEIPGLTKK